MVLRGTTGKTTLYRNRPAKLSLECIYNLGSLLITAGKGSFSSRKAPYISALEKKKLFFYKHFGSINDTFLKKMLCKLMI